MNLANLSNIILSKKYSHFALNFSASDCPTGYYFQAGDKVGNPTEIDSAKAEEIGECGRRCDKNKKCRSIEWSDSDKNCVLLTAESTDGPKWKDYRFCSKIKGKKYSAKICLILIRNLTVLIF